MKDQASYVSGYHLQGHWTHFSRTGSGNGRQNPMERCGIQDLDASRRMIMMNNEKLPMSDAEQNRTK